MNFSCLQLRPPENTSLDPGMQVVPSDSNLTPQCEQHLDFIFWILNGIVGVAIVVGNSFTCTVFLSSPYLRQNYMNIYLISLGVADISMALLVVPGFAAFCSGCSYQWTKYCWVFSGARDIAFPATVLNLLAITYDRYLAVLRPLRYASTMTNRRVFLILSVVWGTPFIVSSLRNIWQHSWARDAISKADTVYNALLSILFTLLPITVMLVINLKLIKAIQSHKKRIHTDMVESLMNYSDRGLTEGKKMTYIDGETFGSGITSQNQRNAIRRKKGSMSCILIVLIFVICWLPRAFLNFFTAFGRNDLASPALVKASLFFIFFQSSVNPVIYSFYRADFRRAARTLMKCQ